MSFYNNQISHYERMFFTVRSNFVDIVGYQFEKVHTGAIKWLLDSSNELIDHNEKSNVLRNLYKMCGILPLSKVRILIL